VNGGMGKTGSKRCHGYRRMVNQ